MTKKNKIANSLSANRICQSRCPTMANIYASEQISMNIYIMYFSLSLSFPSFSISIHWHPEHQSIYYCRRSTACTLRNRHEQVPKGIDKQKPKNKNKSHNTTYVQLVRPPTHFSRLAQNTSESISAVFAMGKIDVFCIRLRANQNTKSHFAIVNIQIYSDIFNPQPTLVCPGVYSMTLKR